MVKSAPLSFAFTYTLFILFSFYALTKILILRPISITSLFLQDDILLSIPSSDDGVRLIAEDEIDRDAFYSSRTRYSSLTKLDVVSDAIENKMIDQDIFEVDTRGLIQRDLDFRITIHVFAWQRSHSLRRLLDSLSGAEYMGLKGINMVIHVDGNPRKEVLEVVKAFEWSFGELTLDMKKERVGLRDMIMSSWRPRSDNEYALFFEDDIQVSPLYFQYTVWCINNVLQQGGEDIIGCSLYTPRLDEISPTDDPQHPPLWDAQSVVGMNNPVFLFQLPCSWGAVYKAKNWLEFVEYYQQRIRSGESIASGIPQELRSNTWGHSWKKYFVEFMYLRKHLVLYPNLHNQKSFSTNYYEEGVHSVPSGMEIQIPDKLRVPELIDTRFTVPLLGYIDQPLFRKQFGLGMDAEKLMRLPVVDVLHRAVGAYGNFGRDLRDH